MRKTAFTFILLFLFFVPTGAVFAEDLNMDEAALAKDVYAFPAIKPDITVFGGYRVVDLSGSERAEEHEYLHNSIVFGGEAKLFPFPHRLHLELDIKNNKDYFGDVSYGYRDTVLFRWVNSTAYHNLDNFELIDFNPGTTPATSPDGPTVDVRDGGLKYNTTTGIDRFFLRLKTPDFPLHFYVKGLLVRKDGTRQQRSLLGSGLFDNIQRTSQSRDIEWETKKYAVGINSHIGPVEAEISHTEKRFDVGEDKVLFDTYESVFGNVAFPHNSIPEMKGSSNTLKIHTSYTGSLVASATLSKKDRENEDSGAKAGHVIGTGGLTWIPSTRLTLYMRYRHKETDIDNPDTASITDLTGNTTAAFQVRPSISSITDTVSLTGKYRLGPGLTLRANYSYDDIRRTNADEWDVPDSTQRNTFSASADVRPARGFNLRARYKNAKAFNPAYNTEPDHSSEVNLSISWVTRHRLNTLLSYMTAKEKRNDLVYANVTAPNKRLALRQKLMGCITLLTLKNLSLTAGYAYMHNKVDQNIVYADPGSPSGFDSDPDVPYRDTANNYSFNVNYTARDNLSMRAGVSHTASKITFSPNDPDLTQPVSIASFSKLKIRETVYSALGQYELLKNLVLGLDYQYSEFHDLADNPSDELQDGYVHIVLLTLAKRWL